MTQPKPNDPKENVSGHLAQRGVSLACILIDCFYIAIWILSVWATNKYVANPLALKGADKIILDIFQVVSGLATLTAVLVYTYGDLRIIIIRTNAQIRKEEIKAKEYLEGKKN